MTLSFVVTSYNILPYIGRCLASLAACARPGDRVIAVDDGSTDGTAEALETLLAESGFDPEVALHPVLLGSNTMGGVGIAANTGLHAALSDPGCAAVFFVDGDDWLEPAGFQACRRAFETALRAALRADGIDTVMAGWTPLGHYELQRKRARMEIRWLLP